MTLRLSLASALVLSLATLVLAVPPKVVITSPDSGEIDVSPDVKEIRIEFDQPMDARGRSIVGGGESFPEVTGQPKWANERTFVLPVTLKPDRAYQFSINNDTFKGFANKRGEPAEWYPVQFHTRAAGAAAAEPDATPEQNKAALAMLRKVIDEDYAYRDRKRIDWAKEIAKRQAAFENARSANEFARLTTHLLRLAEDAHVSVKAGDVHLGTRANSDSPNFNYALLKQSVPNWTEHPGGVITGRFDDGVGYVAFTACTKEQADAFDAALDSLKDAKALIVDARFNGGGGEDAAQQVAGRFVAKPAVYSRNRIRAGGQWQGPFDRTVEPRGDAERYDKPVAVLIGPKVASSAESFVLMMKHGGNAKLIGDATKGSSGRPMPHELGNGVTVYLSSWEDKTPDGAVLEGRGVRPDLVAKTAPRDLETKDAVLDAGLKFLRGQANRPARLTG